MDLILDMDLDIHRLPLPSDTTLGATYPQGSYGLPIGTSILRIKAYIGTSILRMAVFRKLHMVIWITYLFRLYW